MDYGYQIDFKNVILPEWEAWEGNGISDIPGKNVTLKNGSTGSILLNSEGISVYSTTLDDLYEVDMGEVFLEHATTKSDKHLLESYLTDKDLEEALVVYDKFMEREDSYVPRKQQ